MRVRDKHFLLAELVMCLCCVASCVASVVFSGLYVRRLRSDFASLVSRTEVSERTVADASACALAAADFVRDHPVSSDSDAPSSSRPRVLGYGQGRTQRHRYLYRDIEQDGVVSRDYFAWLPLKNAKSSSSFSH